MSPKNRGPEKRASQNLPTRSPSNSKFSCTSASALPATTAPTSADAPVRPPPTPPNGNAVGPSMPAVVGYHASAVTAFAAASDVRITAFLDAKNTAAAAQLALDTADTNPFADTAAAKASTTLDAAAAAAATTEAVAAFDAAADTAATATVTVVDAEARRLSKQTHLDLVQCLTSMEANINYWRRTLQATT